MSRILIRAVPFSLSLALGLVITGAIGRRECKRPSDRQVHVSVEVPLKIQSVPDLDFPESARRLGGGTLQLRALFDLDGTVKGVRLYPMIPFGVREYEVGQGRYADYTEMMKYGKFVKSLPDGLVDSAIKQVHQIRFTPKTVDGAPASQWVLVNTVFNYNESRWSTGCNSIQVTVMDDSGRLWHGNTWVDRNRGCIKI